MTTYGALQQTLIVFLIMMLPGIILGKCKMLHNEAISSINGILLYIAMPMLVLSNLLSINLMEIRLHSIIIVAIMLFLLSALLIFLGLLIFKRTDKTHWRTDCFCATFSNCGFMGIPVATLAFSQTPEIAVFVSLYNVFSCFLIWTLGVLLLTGDVKQIRISRAVLNPVTVAFLGGILLSLIDIGRYVPVLSSATSMLAALTTPLSMILLGFTMTKRESVRFIIRPNTIGVCVIKLIISPLLAIGGICLLRVIGIDDYSLEIALIISASVSTAATSPAMAECFGGDSNVTAGMTVATTLLCTLTFPLLYALFCQALSY